MERDVHGRFIKGCCPKTCFKIGQTSLRKGIKISKDSETYKKMKKSGTWGKMGKEAPNWKGGKSSYYRKNARKIIEKYYNIKLKENEVVHHIDLYYKNNSLSNLKIMLKIEHDKYHANLKKGAC